MTSLTAFRSPTPFKQRVLLFWFCALSILVLALAPSLGTVPMPTIGWDKANHALAFGALAFLGCWAYPFAKKKLLVLLFFYGALIELLQWLTPYREADLLDLLADTVGITIGYALVCVLFALKDNETR